jgi:hypothetical protein
MLVFALLSLHQLPNERRRVRNTVVLFVMCLAGQFVGALLEALSYSRAAVMIHEIFVIGSGMRSFACLAIFVFRIILPRLGIVVARIAEDIIVLVGYVPSSWHACTSSDSIRRVC